MLTILASGLSASGFVFLALKFSTSLRSLLDLSSDLDPLRPTAASEVKTPTQANVAVGEEPCAESMFQLSRAVAPSRNVHSDAEPVAAQPEVRAA
jgi:hypothetical protein